HLPRSSLEHRPTRTPRPRTVVPPDPGPKARYAPGRPRWDRGGGDDDAYAATRNRVARGSAARVPRAGRVRRRRRVRHRSDRRIDRRTTRMVGPNAGIRLPAAGAVPP